MFPDMHRLKSVLPQSEHVQFADSLSGTAKRAIRLRVDRTETELPFKTTIVPWYRYGRYLEDDSVRPAAFLNYATSDYYIQDAASMLPLALLNLKPDARVCDLCAAPGGKAGAIAEQLNENGCLIANETIHSRVEILKFALARTGGVTYAVGNHDPSHLASHASQMMDAVLVDAPCSGQALVAKGKRGDNAFSVSQVEHCVLRQRRILDAAIRMLRVGGCLVYSTCTFALEENENQIAWIMQQHPDCWEPVRIPELANWESKIETGCYRLWPHRDACAGGFAAGLRLKKELDLPISSDVKLCRRFPPSSQSRKDRPGQQDMWEFVATLGKLQNVQMTANPRGLFGASQGVQGVLGELDSIELDTTPLCLRVGKHWVPTHALAMLHEYWYQPQLPIEIGREQALRFMSGHPLDSIPQPDKNTAWGLAQWNRRSLGWLKSAGNRWNNQLPKWARLTLE